MKTITDLQLQVKNIKRVNVYLDGAFYCGLDLITVYKYRLKKGQEIDEKKLIEIQKSSEFQACFDSAVNYISKSLKTAKQVRDKLIKKGYLEEIVNEVIEKLKEYGYLSDEEYAKKFVSTYKEAKGKRLIKAMLKQKGVSDSEIIKAIDVVEDQTENAKKLAEKYLKNKDKDFKSLQKCYNYLLSKGFDYDEAKNALHQFSDESVE